jgi:hypothetical protein
VFLPTIVRDALQSNHNERLRRVDNILPSTNLILTFEKNKTISNIYFCSTNK